MVQTDPNDARSAPQRRTLAYLLISAAAWLALLALAAAVSLHKIRSFDYWLHLRTGKLILETGSVPATDPYLWALPGLQWLDVHWLFQVGLHGVYSLGGHPAVVVMKLVLVLALITILASIGWRRGRPGVTVAGLALMLLVVFERIMARPELVSFVLLASVLALLERFRRTGDRWIYCLVVTQLVWVNVHGSIWPLSMVVLGAHLAAELLRPVTDRDASLRPPRLRRLAAVLVLAGVATLANPHGWQGAIEPLRYFGMIGSARGQGIGAVIAELEPLFGARHPLDPLAVGVFLTLAALSLAAMLANARRLPASDPVCWGAFLYLALAANRNRAFFAIVAAPILVRNLNELLDALPLRRPRWANLAAALLPLLVLAAAVDVARGGWLGRLRENAEPGLGILERLYPVGAAEWIARERPPPPIAHDMVDGGYLIWRLYPEYRPLLDGRLFYDPEQAIDLVYAAPPGFRRLDARYGFGAVLVHHSWVPSQELLWWLYRSQDWQLAFADDVAVVFARRRPGVGRQQDLDIDDPWLFPPLDAAPGPDDFARRKARTELLYALHRYRAALRLWEKTAARYPEHPEVPYQHARMLYATGAIPSGDAVLDRLLEERPDDARLLGQVADLMLAAGRRGEAKALYDAALEIDPRLAPVLMARRRIAAQERDAETEIELNRRLLEILAPIDPLHDSLTRRQRALQQP